MGILFIGGYRVAAMQAVKSSLNPDKVGNVFGEVNREWGRVYLLETESGIKTALAEKKDYYGVVILHWCIIRGSRLVKD